MCNPYPLPNIRPRLLNLGCHILLGLMVLITGLSAADHYQASVTVDVTRPLGAINPDIYGQYLEHVDASDECIYPAIWDDTSSLSDTMGLRRDVVEAVRALDVPVIRWPGGCFADVYHWENGIGERTRRPVLPNLHWKGTDESHQFGTDEFLRFCELTGAKPYINVNLGSGTLEEALRWLEYCNGGPDTPQGMRRAANGRSTPYDVTLWGIGNETWGPWETGHTDAVTYSRQLTQWAQAMRARDPRIKILGVGSMEGNNRDWDRTVLANAGDTLDYLTFHTYGFARAVEGEYEKVVYAPEYIETRLRRMLSTIDETVPHRADAIRISVDEWNIRRVAAKLDRKAPRNLQDTLFVAGMLNTMVRLSPRVAMANYVFLVNGHAPLLVNGQGIVRTPLYHVFAKYRRALRGTALATNVDCPTILPPPQQMNWEKYKLPADYVPQVTPLLHVAAAVDESGTMAISLVNRHEQSPAEVALRLPEGYGISAAWTLEADGLLAANTFAEPERIVPREVTVSGRPRKWTCPPRSVVILTLAKN